MWQPITVANPIHRIHMSSEHSTRASSQLPGAPGRLTGALTGGPYYLHGGFMDWHDLWCAARVCRFWRNAITTCAPLWAHLDLYDYGRRALRILPRLLPLSGHAPLALRLWFINDDEHSNNIGVICSQLEPHLHRLRTLTVRSRRRSNYVPLFALLQHGAPLLRYIDVSHDHRESVPLDFPPDIPSACLALAPNLSFVHWGSHRLPDSPRRLFQLTDVRIDCYLIPMNQIFSLLQRVRTLHIDAFNVFRDDQPLPLNHPLESLTLGVHYIEQTPYPFSWALVQSLGIARVALLRLCNYATTVVIDACADPDWQLTSLTIDYDDFVDASFARRNSDTQCRMTNLAPYRSKKSGMMRVMRETDWMRALESLTLSMELSVEQKRPSLLLPRGRLPALRVFSLICGMKDLKGDGKVERWGSLLDEPIMADCGLLDAPHLRAMRLLSRSPRSSGDGGIVSPAALARFIAEHMHVDGGRVSHLRISIFLQLEDNAAGRDALRAVVDGIEHWI